MHKYNDYLQKISKNIMNMHLENQYSFIKIEKIAIYQDGFLYLVNDKIPFSEEYRQSIPYSKEYAILSNETLSFEEAIDTGLFVKAMVYNYLYLSNDSRVPNDLLALDYPKSYLNFDYMRYERQLLAKAATATDKYLKLSYFRMFLNVRDLRRQIIGEEFSTLEYKLETIEGLAQFATYKVISILDKKRMTLRLKELMGVFSIANRQYFDFRHGNIYSGLMMAIVMDDLNLSMEDIYQSGETFYAYAIKKFEFIHEPIPFKSDKTLLTNWNQYLEDVRDKFTIFFDNNPIRVNGSYQIYSYNPERIFKEKGNMYHESFVILKDLLTNELIYIQGPVVTKIMENSTDICTAYYRLGGKNQCVQK